MLPGLRYTILLLIILCFSCKKDNSPCETPFDHSKWDHIIAGNNSDAIHSQRNDTINSTDAWNNQPAFPLDINNDGKIDLELKSTYSVYFGQTQSSSYALIKTWEGCELLIDSSSKEILQYRQIIIPDDTSYFESGTIDSVFIVPKGLEKGTVINYDGDWFHSNGFLNLSFNRDLILTFEDTLYEFATDFYIGWDELEDRYIGFRVFTEVDTLYGFLQIEVAGNRIHLEEITYR